MTWDGLPSSKWWWLGDGLRLWVNPMVYHISFIWLHSIKMIKLYPVPVVVYGSFPIWTPGPLGIVVQSMVLLMVQPGSRVHIGQWTFQKIARFVHPPSITTLNPTNSKKSEVITAMINTILTLPYVSAILSVVPASGCARCCSSARTLPTSCLGAAASRHNKRWASGIRTPQVLWPEGLSGRNFQGVFFGILTGGFHRETTIHGKTIVFFCRDV